MALMGIMGFLTFERVLTIVSDLCNKSNRKTTKVSSKNSIHVISRTYIVNFVYVRMNRWETAAAIERLVKSQQFTVMAMAVMLIRNSRNFILLNQSN